MVHLLFPGHTLKEVTLAFFQLYYHALIYKTKLGGLQGEASSLLLSVLHTLQGKAGTEDAQFPLFPSGRVSGLPCGKLGEADRILTYRTVVTVVICRPQPSHPPQRLRLPCSTLKPSKRFLDLNSYGRCSQVLLSDLIPEKTKVLLWLDLPAASRDREHGPVTTI